MGTLSPTRYSRRLSVGYLWIKIFLGLLQEGIFGTNPYQVHSCGSINHHDFKEGEAGWQTGHRDWTPFSKTNYEVKVLGPRILDRFPQCMT